MLAGYKYFMRVGYNCSLFKLPLCHCAFTENIQIPFEKPLRFQETVN